MSNPKESIGASKAPMHQSPILPLIQMNNVMAVGAHKYGIFNYRGSKVDALTYVGAINRHFLLWQDGEDNDKESGQNHLAHIMANCAILLDCMLTDNLIDNRSKTGQVSKQFIKSEKSFKKFKEKVKK